MLKARKRWVPVQYDTCLSNGNFSQGFGMVLLRRVQSLAGIERFRPSAAPLLKSSVKSRLGPYDKVMPARAINAQAIQVELLTGGRPSMTAAERAPLPAEFVIHTAP
jgi:hypothetical protein